jgi:hypothetical protein
MDYYRQNSLLSSAKVPTLDMTNTNRGVQQTTGLIDNLIQRDRAKKQQEIENQYRQEQLLLQRAADKRAEENQIFNQDIAKQTLGITRAAENRAQTKFDEESKAKYATDNAVNALLHKDLYTQKQITGEQRAIDNTVPDIASYYDRLLSKASTPEEINKITAEKNSAISEAQKAIDTELMPYYADVKSGDRANQIFDEAITAPNVDQKKFATAQEQLGDKLLAGIIGSKNFDKDLQKLQEKYPNAIFNPTNTSNLMRSMSNIRIAESQFNREKTEQARQDFTSKIMSKALTLPKSERISFLNDAINNGNGLFSPDSNQLKILDSIYNPKGGSGKANNNNINYSTREAYEVINDPENYAENQVKNEVLAIKDTVLSVEENYNKRIEEAKDPVLKKELEAAKQEEIDSIEESLKGYAKDVISKNRHDQIVKEAIFRQGVDFDQIEKVDKVLNPSVSTKGERILYNTKTGNAKLFKPGEPIPENYVEASVFNNMRKNQVGGNGGSSGGSSNTKGYTKLIEDFTENKLKPVGLSDQAKVITLIHNAEALGIESTVTEKLLNQAIGEGTIFFNDSPFDALLGSIFSIVNAEDNFLSTRRLIKALTSDVNTFNKIREITGLDTLDPEQAAQLLLSNKFAITKNEIQDKNTGKILSDIDVANMLRDENPVDETNYGDTKTTTPSNQILNFDNNVSNTPKPKNAVLNFDNNDTNSSTDAVLSQNINSSDIKVGDTNASDIDTIFQPSDSNETNVSTANPAEYNATKDNSIFEDNTTKNVEKDIPENKAITDDSKVTYADISSVTTGPEYEDYAK